MTRQQFDLSGFDKAEALERFFGDQSLLEKYIGLMIIDFNERLAVTRTAIEKCHFSEAAQQLHTLQGSAFALAAIELASACKFCEVMCLKSDAKEALNSLEVIELKLSKITREVSDFER